MVTFIALIITTLTGLIGLLYKTDTEKKKPEPIRKKLTKGGWALLLLLGFSFAVSLYSTIQDRESSEQKAADEAEKYKAQIISLQQIHSLQKENFEIQKTNFEKQLELTKSESEVLKLKAENSLLKLEEVKKRTFNIETVVTNSVDRVDAFEVDLTFKFTISEAGFDTTIKNALHDIIDFYSVVTKDDSSKLLFGVSKHMYGGENSDEEGLIFRDIDRGLDRIKSFDPPILFIRKKGSYSKNLVDVIYNSIGFELISVVFDKSKLPDDVICYYLANPRLIKIFPPSYIGTSQESWFIRDKNASDPLLELTWRYRIFSNAKAGLRLLNDFRDMEVAVFSSRIFPDYDPALAMGYYNKRFGEISNVSLLVGGMNYNWTEKNTKQELKLWSPKRDKEVGEYAAQLLSLRTVK